MALPLLLSLSVHVNRLLRLHYDSLAEPTGPLPCIPVSVVRATGERRVERGRCTIFVQMCEREDPRNARRSSDVTFCLCVCLYLCCRALHCATQLLAGHQLALRWCLDFLTTDYPARRAAADAAAATAAASSSAAQSVPVAALSPLPHPVAPIQLSNLPALLCVIRAQLMSKQPLLQLNDDERHFLSVLTLQAFLKGLQRPPASASGPGPAAGTGFSSNIRVHEMPVGLEGGVMRSSIWDGVVLDAVPLPIHRTIAALCDPAASSAATVPGRLRRYVGLRVVLYNINLTFAETEHLSPEIGLTHVDDGSGGGGDRGGSYQTQLRLQMRRLVQQWHDHGVTMLACQKVVHPHLKSLCISRGILPLERLSALHFRAVHLAAGGGVLSGVEPGLVNMEVLGRLGALEERVVGRRVCLFLSPSTTPATATDPAAPAAAAGGIATIMLSAPTLAQQAELAQLLPRVLKILTGMLRAPAVCAGAGATELALAVEIRRRVAERHRAQEEARARVRRDIGEKVRIKAELTSQIAAARAAVAAAAAAGPASPVASTVSPASSDPSSTTSGPTPSDELSTLETSLYSSQLSRLSRQDHMLGRACLQVAEVLEDVACFTLWNSARFGGDQHSGTMLLEEVKQRFRGFYEAEAPPPTSTNLDSTPSPPVLADTTCPAASSAVSEGVAQVSPAAVDTRAHSTDESSSSSGDAAVGAVADEHGGASANGALAAGADASSSDAHRLALAAQAAAASESEPLPQPEWSARPDWRLEFEARSAPIAARGEAAATLTRIADTRGSDPQPAPQPQRPMREPHALYGCHAQSACPSVVYRVQPSNGALVVDADTVLDPLYVKRAALQIAIEAAGVLMRVDQVVHHQT